MIKLNDNVKNLSGVSEKRAGLYKKLGISTVGELLSHYPKSYIDFTQPILIDQIPFAGGEWVTIRATVKQRKSPFIGKVSVYKVVLADESGGEIICTFFNSDYNYNRLIEGREYIFYGRLTASSYGVEITNPIFIFPDVPDKLLPKYRMTSGITRAIIAANVKTALATADLSELDDLPNDIIAEYSLMTASEAVRKIHFPTSTDEGERAKHSLVFKELLTLQLGMSLIRSRNRKLTGARMNAKTDSDLSPFYGNLPFKPTSAQFRAVDDCIADMKKAIPMNRLLQGDVGSGKTMVAAALAYHSHLNGFQTAIMAPTEILANQHYDTLRAFLEPCGIKCVMITGGVSASDKKARLAQIKSGEAGVIVGTHALIQKGVVFNSLGLVVTDEQHRFGVGQRATLISKGANPHTLVMSATPIPRTLGLIIYGDLDISLLDEMPKGRLEIKTYSVDSSYRERLYKFIIKQVNEGRQAYIVCPLIEESADGSKDFKESKESKASAVKYYNEVSVEFAGIKTGLLHGRMKQSDKDSVMSAFKSGEIKVLVSTTVIEVGVDVPNSTVMLIENAEQFGLSQLHQLRGRVGRGTEQSYCILVTDSDSAYTKARIQTMTDTCNGFEIAGKDLELRGPGDFFGSKQHGLPMLKIAALTADSDVLEETQTLAKRIIREDPELSNHPELRTLTQELFKDSNEYGFN